jgi:hypothetical protein
MICSGSGMLPSGAVASRPVTAIDGNRLLAASTML